MQCTEGFLHVHAEGKDESGEEVLAYGQAILAEALRTGCNRVLCDERELEYAIGTFDIYESAKAMAEIVPRVGKVAIIYNPKCFNDAELWETVAVNRSLRVRFFVDPGAARTWLTND